jgi:type I restriction enzyme S subunit
MTPPGYKQTKVGVIPEEWEVCRLDALGTGPIPPIKAGPFGSSLTKDIYVQSGFKVYGQEQVIRGDYLFGDYFITLRKYRELESCAVRPGDILLSLVGTVGKLLVVTDDAPAGVINPRLIRFSFDKSRICSQFFKFLFESGYVQSLLERNSQGGTMGVLNAGILRPFCIQLPPLPKQRAIATALSDVDALLAALDRLIAKQRDLKQAAMQQLLTGQTRLPGFEGEWETKRLGNIFTISAGKSKSAYIVTNGDFWICDMGSVSTNGRLIVSKQTNHHGDFLNIGDLIMPKDDIGGGNIIGKVGYIDANDTYVLGDHVYCLRALQGNPCFLAYVINSHQTNSELRKKVIGSAQLGLGRKSVTEQEIQFPPHPEQTAIATVLSDMDLELAALEQRRDKTRALKQGMMQELLTGRTRLL